jgi:hypothetical protein
MHLAFELKRVSIAKLLEENEFYDVKELFRNERGLLPGEMNHRMDENAQFEKQAEIENFIEKNKRLYDPVTKSSN